MARFHESIFGIFFDDLDPFGILHNARYLLLFERSIGEFWRHLGVDWRGELDAAKNPDQFHLVRANHLEYHSPVRGTGQVRVRLQIARLGRTSLTFAVRVMPMDEDMDHATGTRTLVRIDPEAMRSAPWSEAFRQKVAPYVIEGE